MRIVASLFFIKVRTSGHTLQGMYKKSISSLGFMMIKDVFLPLIQM